METTEKITTIITKDIDKICLDLMRNEAAVIPTETVYGLAAKAYNPDAVLKIYEIKERPKFNPLIVHIYDEKMLEEIAEEIPDFVLKLIEKFCPGPLTFVLKKKKIIPDIVTAGLDTVAVRFPAHEMTRELIKQLKCPLCAPSANRSGKLSPTSAEEAFKELNGRVRFILDGGKCDIGIESTVIDCSGKGITMLRPGFISKEQIEKAIRRKVKDRDKADAVNSPGLMRNHYAPETPLHIIEEDNIKFVDFNKTVGKLDFEKYSSVEEIAKNLFKDIRELDEKGYSYIVARKVADEGLGIAINDRLEKASSGKLSLHKERIKLLPK